MGLDYYLKKFRDIYPSGPKIMEVFQLYKEALSSVTDMDLAIGCQRALRECKYFPTPAEILALCPKKDFLATSEKYEEISLSPEDRREFESEMNALKQKLGVKPQIIREPPKPYVSTSNVNYIAMVGSQTLQQWAADQDLNDDLPRSKYEIEFIKQVKNYGKSKKKRSYEQRTI